MGFPVSGAVQCSALVRCDENIFMRTGHHVRP
jgi:hypothetical protein